MEIPTDGGSEERDGSIPEVSKEEQLQRDAGDDNMETDDDHSPQASEESKATDERPVRTCRTRTTTTADLVRAFDAANIPLQKLNVPELVQYLQDNVSDLTAASSREQLKRCYQKFISRNNKHASPLYCSVLGCINWSTTDHNYTVFPFPDCKESIKLWKQSVTFRKGRKATHGVCELHFDEDFLIRDSENLHRVTLMPGAIPKNFHGKIEPPKPTTVESIQLITIKPIIRKFCRLCGLSVMYPMTNTVSELRMEHHLKPVLEICLELNDRTHSSLPDSVCDGCTKMVRFIGKFAENCWDAQQRLLGVYAGGFGRKVQPWKRFYQYVEDDDEEEERVDLPTESSDPSESEQVVLVTVEEEQISKIEFEEAPQDLSVKPEPDDDPAKSILIKEEPSDNCNSSINEENVPETINQECPPQKLFKPTTQQKEISGRYRKYECNTCWQRFNSQVELTMHTRKHERERSEGKSMADAVLTGWAIDTIKCLQCRKMFESIDELKAHTAQEHKLEVYCPVCGIKLRNKEVLMQHRKRAKRCFDRNASN